MLLLIKQIVSVHDNGDTPGNQLGNLWAIAPLGAPGGAFAALAKEPVFIVNSRLLL
jgi:hypothetical protein